MPDRAVVEETMDDKERGLYHKYNVTKVDTGEAVQNCIVLRPDRDKAAWDALWDYASYIAVDSPQFATQLGNWLNGMEWPAHEEAGDA